MKRSISQTGRVLTLGLLLASFGCFAADRQQQIFKNVSLLGYCYQFPTVYKKNIPAENSVTVEQVEKLEKKYIQLVLQAPQDSEAYFTRTALEDGREQFLKDVTYLSEADLESQYRQCNDFLGSYIKRVNDIEEQAPQYSPVN